MATLTELVRRHTGLGAVDEEWLHLLVGDWQLLSDLSFADLVLWVPRRDGGFVAVAHCRPSTGPTVHYDDVVGQVVAPGARRQLDAAYADGRSQRAREPQWRDDAPVREEAVPVVRDGTVVAVLGRYTNLATARTPSRLELTYLQLADALTAMVAGGGYPVTGAPTGLRRGAPRVGDGLIRLDVHGTVRYASPNAVSDLHRLGFVGNLVGQSLAEVVTGLVEAPDPVDEGLPLVLTGRAPWRTDVEARGVALSLRAVPLTDGPPQSAGGRRTGAIVLCRDVSELRRRERELLTKDATIREIHHRVKNNLQTVSALLRLQARRLPAGEGRAALEEAVRRVATIALVHETLAQGFQETVDLDDVVDRAVRLACEVAGTAPVTARRTGRFGVVRAEDATPLALVITELVTNAVEHGLAGRAGEVEVDAHRDGQWLTVRVRDDGVGVAGLQPGAAVPPAAGLGTQIVQALVQSDLRGRITWAAREGGGTEVTVEARLR